MPIDLAVTEPRLRRPDRSIGHLGRLAPRQLADDEVAPLRLQQIERPRLHLMFLGEVQERGQQRARLDSSRSHELRDREHLHLRFVCIERGVGQRTVRGSQIDADDILRNHHHPSACCSLPSAEERPDGEADSLREEFDFDGRDHL